MLPLTMIASLVLLAGTSVNGYTISRTQDYPSYASVTGGHGQTFSSLKEAQESLASSNYAPVSSQRQYSTLYGGHSASSSFGEAPAQTSSYGGHSGAPDALNSLSSSYQSDAADLGSSYSAQDYTSGGASQHGAAPSVSYSGYSGGQSEQLSGLDYASSAPVSTSYTAGGAGSSYAAPGAYSSGNSGSYSSSPSSYSASSPVSASYSASSPVSASYSASSPVSASYAASTPVAASYASSGYTSAKGHTPYTSTSGVSFGSASGFSGSSHYPAEQSASYADSPRFPAALKNFMNSVHRESSGAYFARPSSSHGSNYIHPGAKGPGYYGGFPKAGGKIIIVKDGHAMMHPEAGFSGSMSYPAGSNYKVRNAGPFSSGHHYPAASHPAVYSGGSHPGGASSYFQY